MPLSDGISLETVKIDEMGKGRDLPIPCPRDNICCKHRGHALGLWLAQPSVPGFLFRTEAAALQVWPTPLPETWLPTVPTPKDLARGAQHHQHLPDVLYLC